MMMVKEKKDDDEKEEKEEMEEMIELENHESKSTVSWGFVACIFTIIRVFATPL